MGAYGFHAFAAAFALGILAHSFHAPWFTAIAVLIFAAVVAVLRPRLFGLSLLVVVALVLGIARALVVPPLVSVLPEEAREFVGSGIVLREEDHRAESTRYVLELTEPEQAAGERVLVLADRHASARYGDLVSVRGSLDTPEAFVTESGRVFDYSGYLRKDRVARVVRFASVETVEHERGNPVVAALLSVKRAYLEGLARTIPEPYASLASGITAGEDGALGEGMVERFRDSGLVHVMVLSGYNVTVVAEGALLLLAFVLPRGAALVGAGTVVAAFAVFGGLTATVLRASLMGSIALLARLLGRRKDALRALLAAFLGMLVVNPALLLHDLSFQLSFVATIGLVALSPIVGVHLSWVPERFALRETLAATLATTLAVLPILVGSFGVVSLVAIVANVLALPLVPPAMLLSALASLFSSVPFLGTAVGLLATAPLAWIVLVADACARVPFASVLVPDSGFVGPLVATLFSTGVFAYLYATRPAGAGRVERAG